MKKGVNWIKKIKEKNLYQILKTCYIIHFGEKLDQIYFKSKYLWN